MKEKFCVIMAGGTGSRFWPLSKEERPKQFIDILGTGETMIRTTFERFREIIPDKNFVVMTNCKYRDMVKEELPELDDSQILCEPIKRNTAPCIAYAAYHILSKNPDAVMVVTPSDHYVTNTRNFRDVISDGMEFADANKAMMTIGIEPTRPETGYGYIQFGEHASESIYKVKVFTEKPDLDMAKVFLNTGEFLWNSGIFIWNCKTIIEAFHKFTPQIAALFEEGIGMYNTDKEKAFINRIYPECENISIDYAIMEKTKNVFVHSSSFGWSDIGTWGSLFEHSRKDEQYNAKNGNHIFSYNCSNSIIHVKKEKKAIVDGLSDYIVIDTDKDLLICPRANEQAVKNYLTDVQNATDEKA